MFKAIKRLITSGLKPHSCKLCNNCLVCHECLRERNQIRQCCFGVTEEELDILHDELKNNFALIYPVRKHSFNVDANSSQSEKVDNDSQNCCINTRDKSKFQCNICGKIFKTEFTLTRHFNAHAKVGEKFKCIVCNKCFAINRDLQNHSKLHKDVEDKSRVCMYCEKEFSSWYYLKIHLRRHTGDRPFKCELCDKRYTTQSILNIHYRTHAIKKKAHEDDSFTSELTDSEVEVLEDDHDNFNEQNLDLESFDHEKSSGEMSDDQDFISNLADHFNLEDDFDDEASQESFGLSLGKGLDLETFDDDNDSVKIYKSPLVIKLKPSI